jgi:hypothetical protein
VLVVWGREFWRSVDVQEKGSMHVTSNFFNFAQEDRVRLLCHYLLEFYMASNMLLIDETASECGEHGLRDKLLSPRKISVTCICAGRIPDSEIVSFVCEELGTYYRSSNGFCHRRI